MPYLCCVPANYARIKYNNLVYWFKYVAYQTRLIIKNFEYYINAINEYGNVDTYYIFTDDVTLSSYNTVLKYLTGKNVVVGNPNSFYDDFWEP